MLYQVGRSWTSICAATAAYSNALVLRQPRICFLVAWTQPVLSALGTDCSM